MRILRNRGAELVYHDEHVSELPDFDLKSASLEQSLEGSDAAAILTAHPGLDVEQVLATAPLVVDFRGVTRGIEAPESRTTLTSRQLLPHRTTASVLPMQWLPDGKPPRLDRSGHTARSRSAFLRPLV